MWVSAALLRRKAVFVFTNKDDATALRGQCSVILKNSMSGINGWYRSCLLMGQ
jgi:hypothetical protein